MKFITLLSCVFLVAAFAGQTNAQRARKAVEPRRYHHGRPHGRPHRRPCGSNDLGDYKGGCDISVPVIVMPKGRPIMERVLEWFNCGTEICRPSEPEEPPVATSPVTTDTYTPSSPTSSGYAEPPEPSYPTSTSSGESPPTSNGTPPSTPASPTVSDTGLGYVDKPEDSNYSSMETTDSPYWN